MTFDIADVRDVQVFVGIAAAGNRRSTRVPVFRRTRQESRVQRLHCSPAWYCRPLYSPARQSVSVILLL